jgi:hypothetical protein
LYDLVPAGLAQGGRDEFGADVAFAEGALVHDDQPFTPVNRLKRSPP